MQEQVYINREYKDSVSECSTGKRKISFSSTTR